ncbi:hypothetical protein RUM43_010038 [Polyplax serrata]
MADCEQQTLEIISRNNIEGELASKDKELDYYLGLNLNGEGKLSGCRTGESETADGVPAR